jgi:hypothetical protein
MIITIKIIISIDKNNIRKTKELSGSKEPTISSLLSGFALFIIKLNIKNTPIYDFIIT